MPRTFTPEDRAVLQQAVRLEICRSCQMRPPGSEHFGAIVPRSCETVCPMFAQLDGMHRLVKPDRTTKAVEELEDRVRQLVCQRCPVRGPQCTSAASKSSVCPYGPFIQRVVGLMTMNLSSSFSNEPARPV